MQCYIVFGKTGVVLPVDSMCTTCLLFNDRSQIEGTRVVSPVICKTYAQCFFSDHSHLDYRYPTELMHACSPLGIFEVPHWEPLKYGWGGSVKPFRINLQAPSKSTP
jgi:hypothetical protein